MKTILRSAAAVLCYAAAVTAAGLWAAMWLLSDRFSISPGGSLLLVGIAHLGIYCGGLLRAKALRQEAAEAVMRHSFGLLFFLYLLLLLRFTLFDPAFARRGLSLPGSSDPEIFRRYLREQTNLVPFDTIRRYLRLFQHGGRAAAIAVTNLAGNAAAFMPFALFLPLLVPAARRFFPFALCVLASVLLIEAAQLLFCTGSLDVDDVILNAGGACLCYVLLHRRPLRRLVNRITVAPY